MSGENLIKFLKFIIVKIFIRLSFVLVDFNKFTGKDDKFNQKVSISITSLART